MRGCLCVCVRACVFVCVCVFACERACVRECVGGCISDVLLTQHSMINQRSSLSCLDRRTGPPVFTVQLNFLNFCSF